MRLGGLLLWGALCLVGAVHASEWDVTVEPSLAPPGTVLVCKLVGRAPEGMILAGFHQEAGFYHSKGVSVALLAVPLGAWPGPRSLLLRAGRRRQALTVRVGKDPYPHHRVRAVRGLKAKLASSQAANEKDALKDANRSSLGPPLWNGAFSWPLDPPIVVTSPFGSKRSYNRGEASWRHQGLDLRAPLGTQVLACADGVVLLARRGMKLTGGTILVGHGYGVTSAYFHLSRLRVKAGQRVHAGEPLGLSGSSGLASGPHLHWQIDLRGNATDPRQWLDPVAAKLAANAAP